MCPRAAFAWWVVVGVTEFALAAVLLAYGYWWTIFVTAPATGLCAYFARRNFERARS
jgi:uncharacterized membrane protein